MRALLIPLHDEVYAVDMVAAREVVAAPEITPLPLAPTAVLGVFNLRGDIVPVFDTARLLGLGTGPAIAYVAVVETSVGLAGLTMTALGEAVELGEPVGVTDTPATIASYELGTRLAVLVDVEALLAPVRVAG